MNNRRNQNAELLPNKSFELLPDGSGFVCRLCGSEIFTTRGSSIWTARRSHRIENCADALFHQPLRIRTIAYGRAGKLSETLKDAVAQRLAETDETESATGQASTPQSHQDQQQDTFVGMRVAKRFPESDGSDNQEYFGTVSYRIAGEVENEMGEKETAWHVTYDDGDEEDMNRIEILDAIARAGSGPPERGAPQTFSPGVVDESSLQDADEFIGKRVAQYFPVDGVNSLFYGRVQSKERLLVRRGASLEQVWNVIFDDSDTMHMNRYELAEAIALAERNPESDQDPRDWNSEDLDESFNAHPLADLGQDVCDYVRLEPFRLEPCSAMPVATKWLKPLHPEVSERNIFSYIVDWAKDKVAYHMTGASVKCRLMREASTHGVELPKDIREIRQILGARKLTDVIRHRCMTPSCCYSWLGPTDPKLYNVNDRCPDCGRSRYYEKNGVLYPKGVWFYFGIPEAVKRMFNNPEFVSAWKRLTDLTNNAFRQSAEARRLNAATGMEALLPNNGLYNMYFDGFQAHDDDRHNITGAGMSSLDISDEVFSKECNQQPVGIIPAPEPSNTTKVMREAVLDLWRLSAYGIFITSPLTGEEMLHKAFLAGLVVDRVARFKAELRASNSGRIQCSKCRSPATLRDPDNPKNPHNYIGGYLERFKCLLDIRIGEEDLHAGDERLRLSHDTIVEQGRLVEAMRADLRPNGNTTQQELRDTISNLGCRGLAEPIRILKYADATLLYDYPICHLLCLGLYPQFLKQIVDLLGPRCVMIYRRADMRAKMIKRPSEMSRPVRALLPKSSDNVCSGWKIEDHIHSMECFAPLTLFSCFTGQQQKQFLHRGKENNPDRGGPSLTLIDQVFHLLWRFLSVSLFLLRGADGLRVTDEQHHRDLLELNNAIIERRRSNFHADVDILCKLVETILGPKGCTPNLHDLYCMIEWLIRRKGHPKFELVIERLMHFLKQYVSGPIHECEVLMHELLLGDRAHDLEQDHPNYEADYVDEPISRAQDDRFGGDTTVRMLGHPVRVTAQHAQNLREQLRKLLDRFTDEQWETYHEWDPDDFDHLDLALLEYVSATINQVKVTSAELTSNRKTCDNYILYKVDRQLTANSEPPVEPTDIENYDLEHIPRDYEHLVDDYLSRTFVSQFQNLLLATIPDGRPPIRFAIVRRWEVTRSPFSPRYAGLWEAGESDFELIPMILPHTCKKVTALIPDALPAEQLLRHDFQAKVCFSEVHARSGSVTKPRNRVGFNGPEAGDGSLPADD